MIIVIHKTIRKERNCLIFSFMFTEDFRGNRDNFLIR